MSKPNWPFIATWPPRKATPSPWATPPSSRSRPATCGASPSDREPVARCGVRRAQPAPQPRAGVTALLSLGLGIGINTGIFSMAVEFLLSQPSVTNPGSVVSLKLGGNSHANKEVVDFVRASGLFQDVVGENEEVFINWNDGAETRQIFCRAAHQELLQPRWASPSPWPRHPAPGPRRSGGPEQPFLAHPPARRSRGGRPRDPPGWPALHRRGNPAGGLSFPDRLRLFAGRVCAALSWTTPAWPSTRASSRA
jgi:hypothetical protein